MKTHLSKNEIKENENILSATTENNFIQGKQTLIKKIKTLMNNEKRQNPCCTRKHYTN